MKRVALAACLLMVMPMTAPVTADARFEDRPNGRMQTCTKQWLDRRDAGQIETYKPFLRACLDGRTVAVPVAARTQTRTNKPNRMKVCGARWQQMKASGETGGQTWRQFSAKCLKT